MKANGDTSNYLDAQNNFEKHVLDNGITLRMGKAEDLEQLLELHNANLYDNLSEENRKDGFIRIKYSESDFLTIICCQEIVVASQSNNLIGYYMIACESNSKLLNYQKEKAKEIAANEQILQNYSGIGYGAQICIKRSFRNHGLFKVLLANLCHSVKNKYSLLLCSVSKINTISLERHSHLGWEINSVDINTCYLTYKINPEQ